MEKLKIEKIRGQRGYIDICTGNVRRRYDAALNFTRISVANDPDRGSSGPDRIGSLQLKFPKHSQNGHLSAEEVRSDQIVGKTDC